MSCNFLASNHTKSVFTLIKATFVIYGDFECVLIPVADNNDLGPSTEKYQNHFVCSYGYKLICVDERYSKPYKTFLDKF